MESYGLIAYTPSCDPEGASCPLNDSLKAPWTHRATRYSNLLPRESHKNSDPNRSERKGAMNRALFLVSEKSCEIPMKDISRSTWAMGIKRLKLFGITISRRENQVYPVQSFISDSIGSVSPRYFEFVPTNLQHWHFRRMRTRPYVTLKVGPCQHPWKVNPKGCFNMIFSRESHIRIHGNATLGLRWPLDSDSWFLRWSRITHQRESDGIMGEKTGKFEGILSVQLTHLFISSMCLLKQLWIPPQSNPRFFCWMQGGPAHLMGGLGSQPRQYVLPSQKLT